MFCSTCGHPLVTNAKFCSGCGTAVSIPATRTELSRPSSTARVAVEWSNLLDHVRAVPPGDLSASARFFDLLQRAFRNAEPMELAKVEPIVDFAEDQCCLWHSYWLFSPADSPNTTLMNEQQRWRELYDLLVSQVAEAAPELRDLHEKISTAKSMQQVALRRTEVDAAEGTARETEVRWTLAQQMHDTGMHAQAKALFNKALFPTGSVGAAIYRE